MQMLSFDAVVFDAPKDAPRPAPSPRIGSPPSTGSTLITRAPMSPSSDAPSGAAMIVANSSTVMPSRGCCGGEPFVDGAVHAARGASASTSAVCSPGCGPGPPTSPGVSVSRASSPSCRTAPSSGCSMSTTSRFASMSGWRSASWAVVTISAATLPLALKASIHSSAVRSRTRSIMMLRTSSRASSVSPFGVSA